MGKELGKTHAYDGRMAQAAPFYAEMTHFTLPLHALREELIALAGGWAEEHELHVALERFFPTYGAVAIPGGDGLDAAVEGFGPVRRLCLRRGPFDIAPINAQQFLVRNPDCLVMVLEPVTEDGLRATAITSRMADVELLRWWISLVRGATYEMHRGAWATDPQTGLRREIPDHVYTEGARELWADGVPMRAAAGTAVFDFREEG
jgi:hypothetical protein